MTTATGRTVERAPPGREHVRLAMRAPGWTPAAALFPNSARSDEVAAPAGDRTT